MEHPLIFSTCAFLMVLVLLSWVGYRLYYKPGKFLKQLGRPVITEHRNILADAEAPVEASTLVTFLQQLGSKVPSSESEVASLRVDLVRAGFRAEHSAPVFYGIRIIA